MREGQFIKQNIERWKSYEKPTEDPDEVAKRFTYLVDDLAYAKTYYPFSNTVKFINSLASAIYLSIYRNKKEKSSKFRLFFARELPLSIRRHHRTFLFALLFFLAFMGIGIFSAWQDQDFVRGVLGDEYVDMTERNIARGDPFAVYKDSGQLYMFVRIAFNNIFVSLMLFASGLMVSVGTLYYLFRNAMMLGVFEQMFFHHGLGVQSILVVFIHGTLEISALVIAGAAGLVLGNSILFPKTYTRLQSFRRAAFDAMKIMLCLVPVFIVAAFFESYVTRHTGMPVWMSVLILSGSLWFILWYFVYYPIKVSRRVHEEAIA
ncbi:MAG: stage II sporulation protein M [Flavipsychrobacter sp.]|nr:stage II sporulation protein M [Flavipsychrobacter sp.]